MSAPPPSPQPPPHPPEPSHRLRRAALWSGAGLLLLGLLLVSSIAWVAMTQSGSRFLFARLSGLAPGELSVSAIEGPLRGPLTLHDLHYKNASFELDVHRLRLVWRPAALRQRLVDVTTLQASGVRFRSLSGPTPRQPLRLRDINLHCNLVIRGLDVADIQIARGPGVRPLIVNRLRMQTADWRGTVRVDHVDVTSPDIGFDARGWLRPQGDYPLDLQLAWSYRQPAKLPSFAGSGHLSGTLKALRVDQEIHQPFRGAIHAVVDSPMSTARIRGEVDFERLDLLPFAPTSPVTVASGHLALDWISVQAFSASGHGRVATTTWGNAEIPALAVRRQGDRWHFDRLTVKRPGAPGSLTWVGDFAVPTGKPFGFAGRASWQRMGWPLDALQPTVSSAEGRAALDGTVDGYNVALDATLAFPNVPAGHYRATARGDRRQLVARTVEARLLGGNVAAHGRVAWTPTLAWSVDATATGIDPHTAWPAVPPTLAGGRWRFDGHGDRAGATIATFRADTPHGALEASGTLAWAPALTWRLDARTHGLSPAAFVPTLPAGIAGGDWHLAGTGTAARADLSQVQGNFLGGTVTGAGKVAWKPALAWQFQGTAVDVDPGRGLPGWDGKLTAAFHTAGTQTARGPLGEVVVERVAGLLRARPFSGHGSLQLHEGAMAVADVQGSWGPGRLTLDGQISPQLGLRFTVQQLDLAALVPASAKGVVNASGQLRGTTATPLLTATLAGEQIAFRGVQTARLNGRVGVSLAAGGPIDVDLAAKDVHLGSHVVDTLTVAGHGTREAHTVTIATSGGGATLTVAAAGGLPVSPPGQPLVWRGTLNRLDTSSPTGGNWRLAAPTPLVLGASQVQIQQLCWASARLQGSQLCATAHWQASRQLDIAATVTKLPLTLMKAVFPADLEVEGTVSGQVQLTTAAGGVLVGQAVLQPSAGTALGSASGGDSGKLVLQGGELRLDADAAGISGRAALKLADGGAIQGSANLPGFRLGRAATAQPLIGHVTLQLGDLRFVQALAPGIASTGGQASADLALSGTLASPAFAGSAKLTGARATVPKLGVSLEHIDLTARGNGTGPLAISGSLKSGPGTLTFSGTSALLPSKTQPLRLDLKGERVQFANLDEAKIVANPDLQIVYDGSVLQTAGQVVVPSATVVYKRSKTSSAVEPSPDVVFVGSEKPHAVKTTMAISARVRLILGNDVNLSAEGLKTKLRGSILVDEQPGQGTEASGELQLVEGTFKAYSQDLKIERGRLFWAGGPIFEPGLDIRASRFVQQDSVTAGINAHGTLHAPEVTLWSDPTMSQSEALSYLVLGRSLESAQPQQGSLLANAATSLGLHGGDLLAKKLGSALGLEEAGIQSGQTLQQASFVVGKYLSPRLYLSYGIGLFDASSILKVRYLVSEHLNLQGETGAQTSGDILYTFQTGAPRPGTYRGDRNELPRVSSEELTAPKKVPVGAEGKQPPAAPTPPPPG